MKDEDLKDIFAYLKTVKPVRHRVDNSEPQPCARCAKPHTAEASRTKVIKVYINFAMNVVTWLALIIGGLLLESYLPGYLMENGKNSATKEDIKEITDITSMFADVKPNADASARSGRKIVKRSSAVLHREFKDSKSRSVRGHEVYNLRASVPCDS